MDGTSKSTLEEELTKLQSSGTHADWLQIAEITDSCVVFLFTHGKPLLFQSRNPKYYLLFYAPGQNMQNHSFTVYPIFFNGSTNPKYESNVFNLSVDDLTTEFFKSIGGNRVTSKNTSIPKSIKSIKNDKTNANISKPKKASCTTRNPQPPCTDYKQKLKPPEFRL